MQSIKVFDWAWAGAQSEPLRWILHFGNLPFDDVPLMQEDYSRVQQLAPRGKVPFVLIEGQAYAELRGVFLTVAGKAGLLPSRKGELFRALSLWDSTQSLLDCIVMDTLDCTKEYFYRRLDALAKQCHDTGPYCTGSTVTMADVTLSLLVTTLASENYRLLITPDELNRNFRRLVRIADLIRQTPRIELYLANQLVNNPQRRKSVSSLTASSTAASSLSGPRGPLKPLSGLPDADSSSSSYCSDDTDSPSPTQGAFSVLERNVTPSILTRQNFRVTIADACAPSLTSFRSQRSLLASHRLISSTADTFSTADIARCLLNRAHIDFVDQRLSPCELNARVTELGHPTAAFVLLGPGTPETVFVGITSVSTYILSIAPHLHPHDDELLARNAQAVLARCCRFLHEYAALIRFKDKSSLNQSQVCLSPTWYHYPIFISHLTSSYVYT